MNIEWKENYNIHKANIAGVIDLVVTWTKEGYEVIVNGSSTRTRLKKFYGSIEEAKSAAVKLGIKLLHKALSQIEEE